MNAPIPSGFRRHRTLLLVSAGVVWLLVLLALLAWWLLPRWAPTFVIRYSPMPDMVFRAVIEGDGSNNDASRRLVAMGTRATTTIVTYLHDSDINTILMALSMLEDMKDPQATEAVIAVLTDPRESVQDRAVNTLGQLGDARAIPHLLPFLFHQHLNENAANALRCLPSTAVADALRPLMVQRRETSVLLALSNNSDPRVPAWLNAEMRINVPVILDRKGGRAWQREAADALGEIPQAAGRELLVKAMADVSPAVRKRGVQGMGYAFERPLSEVERAAILRLLSDVDTSIIEAAAVVCNFSTLEAAVPTLLQLLDSPDPAIRKAATHGFGVRLFNEQATTKLIALTSDTDEQVRIGAVNTLRDLAKKNQGGDLHLAQPLIQALRDSSPNVRKAALYGLIHIEHTQATSGLLSALDDLDSGVRELAFNLLLNFNPIMNKSQYVEWKTRREKISSAKP